MQRHVVCGWGQPPLHRANFVAWIYHRLIWIRLGCTASRSICSGDSGGGRSGLGRGFGLIRLVQLVGELVLRFLELLDRLSHSARELRQFLGAEEQKNQEKNPNQVRPSKIQQTGEDAHGRGNIQTRWPKLQAIWRCPGAPGQSLVISRSQRNFAGAAFPGIYLDRNRYRGRDFDGVAVDGGAEPEWRDRRSEAARVARSI